MVLLRSSKDLTVKLCLIPVLHLKKKIRLLRLYCLYRLAVGQWTRNWEKDKNRFLPVSIGVH